MMLDQNYSIEGDKYNYTLKYEEEKAINPDTGKAIISKYEYHYPTMEGCLRKYVDLSLKPCATVEQVIDKINELKDLINSKF